MTHPPRFAVIGAWIGLALFSGAAFSAGWTVTVRAHRIQALTNSDNWGEQDLYWQAHLQAAVGSGGPVHCSSVDHHPDDLNEIKVDWACVLSVAGGPDTAVDIKLEVFDEDTIGDDELDLSIDHDQLGLSMRFEPRTSRLTIHGDPTWTAGSCALGKIQRSGLGGGGGEPAKIEFTISASPAGAPDGDSDSDGLPDSWEVCGVDSNGDNFVDVDLPKMGADVGRKDLFVEVDWMEEPSGATAHTHAPWLPSLINAWTEMDRAPITNPVIDGVAKAAGIALHLDTGILYSNYSFDLEGDGAAELTVAADGTLDLNSDGRPDIGNLGALGSPAVIGGSRINEDAVLSPPASVTGMPTGQEILGPGSDYAAIKGIAFAPARDAVFHYALFAHSYPQVQGGPPNSSGLAETCTAAARCNEFIVTLGGFEIQTVDANRDSEPDGTTAIPGPRALPVHGLIRSHTGTFLHELGHTFGLGHGGSEGINHKPNHLSIMGHGFQQIGLAFDWDGDDRGDGLGLDFNRDGLDDVARFFYASLAGLPLPLTLNEGVGGGPHLDENVPVVAGSRVITRHSCPASPPGAPVVNTRRAGLPIDWNCDGDTTDSNLDVDVNNALSSSGVLEVLTPFDDYHFLQNGGLDVNASPGVGREQQRDMDARTQRIIEPQGRQELELARCINPVRLNFEGLAAGTVVKSQFAPDVTFLEDAARTPTVLGPPDRNGVPTESPKHSLANLSRSGAVSALSFQFRDPQRIVALSFGQAGLSNAERSRTRAVLRAFDRDDLPMGIITKAIPPPNQGITERLTAAAVYADQLIHRVEVSYELGLGTSPAAVNPPLAEPVQIDDLVFCGRVDERALTPVFPPAPKFGDLVARLTVASEVLMSVPGTGEPGNPTTVAAPFSNLVVQVDGSAVNTSTQISRPEGTTLQLTAPANASVGQFLYWRYASGVSFGQGVRTIPLTLLRDGTITAVYAGTRCVPGCVVREERDRRAPKPARRPKPPTISPVAR